MTPQPQPSGPSAEWPALSGAKLASARLLLRAKGRRDGQCLVEGPQCVREALAFGDVRLVITGPEPTAEAAALASDAAARAVPVVSADAKQMRALTDTVTSQGIVAVCGIPAGSLAGLVAPSLVLVFDEVRDPGNVGTLIRSADAFGADAVIATTGTADVWGPKAVRASVGSVFHLPIVTGVAFTAVVAWARGAGLRMLGADAGGRPLPDVDGLASPTVWVVGNEAGGLPPAHLADLDETVAVPMWGRAESLNVATAAAVCLYATALAGRRLVG